VNATHKGDPEETQINQKEKNLNKKKTKQIKTERKITIWTGQGTKHNK
jgi:hypothetical protein